MRRSVRFTLVEMMIVVAIFGLLVALAMPAFLHSVQDSRRNACINNLRVIDYAQQQAMLQLNTDTPTAPEVNQYLRVESPVCPSTDIEYDLTLAPPACPSVAEYPEHVLN